MEITAKAIKLWSMFGSRNTYGTVLTELAKEDDSIMALTADFTKSSGLLKFKELFPERFLSTGIAEQNMIGLASGLSTEGYNVFACSFASFAATRCYEQIKINLGYMQHNVKVVGIAAGLGVSYQGNTHYGLDDVSLMRTIPNMTVIVPSDCAEVAKATQALSKFNGPAYLRVIGEGMMPIVNADDYDFTIGKGRMLRSGKDVAIIANGTMVNESLKAAAKLAEQGIEATVINMHTVKPLDTDIIDKECVGEKLIVTVEEGFVNGGLGSAVAEYVAENVSLPRVVRLGVQDIFPHSGSYQYLLEQCGISAEKIVDKIIKEIK